MTDPRPLLEPLADDTWPGSVIDMREGFAGRLNVYRVMAHHPALLRAWESLRHHVVLHSALGPAQLEIVILRIGHRWQSDYEWNHHVARGLAAGLSAAQIENARLEPSAWQGAALDILLMRSVDALLDRGRLEPEHEAELRSAIGREAVFDLMATVGMYTTLAFIVNTYRTPLEPWLAAQGANARVNPPT